MHQPLEPRKNTMSKINTMTKINTKWAVHITNHVSAVYPVCIESIEHWLKEQCPEHYEGMAADYVEYLTGKTIGPWEPDQPELGPLPILYRTDPETIIATR